MLTQKIALKLIRQELNTLPDGIEFLSAPGLLAYIAAKGNYILSIKDLQDGSYRLRVQRDGQRIDTYYNAETLEEDETRGEIEYRAREAEKIRNAILKHGVDWCKQVYDDWETLIQVELDEAMELGMYPNPEKAIDCT